MLHDGEVPHLTLRQVESRDITGWSSLLDLIDGSTTPVLSIDLAYRYTSFNRSHASLMQELYGAAISIGACILDFLDPRHRTIITKRDLDRALTGERFSTECDTGEGSPGRMYPRFLELTYYPVPDTEGRFLGAAIVGKDAGAHYAAQNARHENRELITALLNAPGYRAVVLTVEGLVVAANEQVAHSFHTTRDALMGRCIFDYWPFDLAQSRRRHFVDTVQTRIAGFFQDELAGRWYSHTLQPIFNAHGEVQLIAFYSLDVTEWRHYEQYLALTWQRARELESIVSRSKSIVMRWRVEPDFPIDYVTDNVEQLGCTAGELVNGLVFWTDLLHPEDAIGFDDLLGAYLAADAGEYTLEYRVIDRTGAVRCVSDQTRAIRDTSGRIASYESVIVDITERVQRERELEILATTADELGAATTRAEMEPIILRAACRALKTDTAFLTQPAPGDNSLKVSRVCGDWTPASGAQVPFSTSVLRHLGRSHEPQLFHNLRTCLGNSATGGATLKGACICIPLMVAERVAGVLTVGCEGAIAPEDARVLTTICDIAASALDRAGAMATLEVLVNERTRQLVETNRRLEQLARHKDEFLSMMSHELRAPLTSILGLSEALSEDIYGRLTERQYRPLSVIQGSGKHLLSLINDILDLSRIEAGRFELDVRACFGEEICASSVEAVQTLAKAKKQALSVENNAPGLVFEADPRRVHQVLVHLLKNAVKFTPENGAIGLQVGADRETQSALLTVWDTGIGIGPDDQQRIFQPFVQLDASLARQYSGSGLGLALVKRIVAAHGGTVDLESAPGRGSRFVVTLPQRRPNSGDA